MAKRHIFIFILAFTPAKMLSNEAFQDSLQARVRNLEKSLSRCQQKKHELLHACDANGCLPRIHTLQERVNKYSPSQENHRHISAQQRAIAQHNRELLSTMTPQQKTKLRKLLAEYRKLYQELCRYNGTGAQAENALDLYFI